MVFLISFKVFIVSYVYRYPYVSEDAHRSQRHYIPLVSYKAWRLGTQLWPSGRAGSALNC